MSAGTRQEFVCSLCEVRCPSEESLASHVRGRYHQLSLDKHREARQTVFVRGFPKYVNLTSDLIKEVFQQCGEVEGVFIKDEPTQRFAIVTFRSEEAVACALQNPPMVERKQLVVKPRDVKPRSKLKQPPPVGGASAMEVESSQYSIPVSKEAIADVTKVEDLSDAVLTLSGHCAMSDQTISHILSLTRQLNYHFSSLYPDSLLLPFGSVITGHGTTTSDCDLSFLTRPLHPHLFTPDVYYPPRVLTLSQLTPHSPPSPASSVSGSSAHSTPEPPTAEGGDDLRGVAGVVRRVGGCERLYVVESARCPIVKFYHTPSKLHVDISINNMLGPHNSRLLRGYSEFDPRVTPLVRVVRVWMREATQRRVNSYAVSLMVVHALQQTTPPVLPCLQDLGPWPRNMDWFKQYRAPSDHVTSGLWSCDFVPIASLMPSENTESVGSLLTHFFRYYSVQFPFQTRIVTIHQATPVSLEEANEMLERPLLVNSPLVVQDPFDHAHNVCKNLSVSMFTHLMARMKEALEVLAGTSPRLLELFVRQAPPPQAVPVKAIALDMATVSGLLDQTGSPLRDLVTELDLTNPITRNFLHCVIARCVVSVIERRFGFTCEPVLSAGHVTTACEPVVSAGHVTTSDDEMTAVDEMSTTSNTDEVMTLSEDLVTSPEDHVTPSEDHVIPSEDHVTSSGGSVVRKRTRSSSSSSDEVKRVKNETVGPSPLDVLHTVTHSHPHTSTYHCTAHENTWVGTRSKRRASGSGLLSSLPTPNEPLLELTLSVVAPDHLDAAKVWRDKKSQVCVVIVQCLSVRHKVHCDQWFAVFKRLLLSPPPPPDHMTLPADHMTLPADHPIPPNHS